MKRAVYLLVISLFTLSFSVPAFGWGQKGHRIIAKIAYDNLSKKAKKQVDQTLGAGGMIYWVNWPDEIKSDTIYKNSHGGHYQDFPAGLNRNDIVAALKDYPKEGGHLFHDLDSIENMLRYAVQNKQPIHPHTLRFFIHLNGDLYCPMHLAHVDDKGGNKVRMKWFGDNTNLHSVWDSKIIESQGYSYSEYAELLQHNYASLRKHLLQDDYDEAELVWQTYLLTDSIYAYQSTWDNNTYHYIYRWHEPMEQQLYIAGIRLARLLNEIFK